MTPAGCWQTYHKGRSIANLILDRKHPGAKISPSPSLAPTVAVATIPSFHLIIYLYYEHDWPKLERRPYATAAMAHAKGFKPPQIREKLIKIGVMVVRHAISLFSLPEVAISRH